MMLEVRVSCTRPVADDIRMLDFVPTLGGALPAFSAGAHIDVYLPGGLVRQYSLCNGPNDQTAYRIGVLLEPNSRGGSKAIHALQEGARLQIDAPRNLFELNPQAGYSVLLAGGIGITPLLSMAAHLAATGRPFEFHYFVRSRSRAAFLEQLESAGMAPHFQLHADDEQLGFNCSAALKRTYADDTHVYVCGPAGFIDAMLSSATAAGYEPRQLHREYFAPVDDLKTESQPFSLELARSGRTIVVGAAETTAKALARCGVNVPLSCEQGVCGTCLTKVLAGTPLHRDVFLSDAERERNDCFTPCCSRSRTPILVVDL
jgi:vanillate O-demethylase ferredoxin subunit